jgi:hypothetical protein
MRENQLKQAGISEVAHLSDLYHKMAIFVAYLTIS